MLWQQILFLALFPMAFFWLRRAHRIFIKKNYSEVALKKGALFSPAHGDEARKRVWPEIQADAWSFQAAGRAKVSPESLGIPKP